MTYTPREYWEIVERRRLPFEPMGPMISTLKPVQSPRPSGPVAELNEALQRLISSRAANTPDQE